MHGRKPSNFLRGVELEEKRNGARSARRESSLATERRILHEKAKGCFKEGEEKIG